MIVFEQSPWLWFLEKHALRAASVFAAAGTLAGAIYGLFVKDFFVALGVLALFVLAALVFALVRPRLVKRLTCRRFTALKSALKDLTWYFVAVHPGAEFSSRDVLAQGRELKGDILTDNPEGLKRLRGIRRIEILNIRKAAHYVALEDRVDITGEFVWNPEDAPGASVSRALQQTQDLGVLLEQADAYWKTADLSGLPDGVRERVITRIAVIEDTPFVPIMPADCLFE